MLPRAYERFLQYDVPADKRKYEALEAILRDSFPVKSYDQSHILEYISYEIGQPRYTPEECKTLGLSYAGPFKLKLRLVRPEGSIEDDVYIGDMPLMLGGGYFIINGVERIVVMQLHRAAGIDFVEDRLADKKIHSCSIVPERGSWVEITVSRKDTLYSKIDQGTKLNCAMFLRAISKEIGTNAEILRTFYETKELKITNGTKEDDIIHRVTVKDIKDEATGEIIAESGSRLQKGILSILLDKGIKNLELITKVDDPLILNTILDDPSKTHEDALKTIFAKLRPGTPVTVDKANQLIKEKFFDPTRYRLGVVGRFRINRKFGSTISEDTITLQKEDIINSIKYILKLRKGEGTVDDIDHLGNRRVRLIDELLADDVRKGFLRLKRALSERLSSVQDPKATPRTILNAKIVSSSIDNFFARSELSQVIDQTNSLSQLTHQRRLSALGPGGLNRRRAGFEVRDVHISHYGRICPIETPEGTNIGLITSLAGFSDTDKYGFLITPFRVVKNGKVTDQIEFLRADEEADKIIAPCDTLTEKDGRIVKENIMARVYGDMQYINKDKVHLMDVSPYQIVSVSTALIPFLEHDDANRALMGSNMQRQAVPLLNPDQAIVATGIEKTVALHSDFVLKAKEDSEVITVTGSKITVKTNDDEIYTYDLIKFRGTNEKTSVTQKPTVKEGDKIKKDQIIADSSCTKNGELALGRNVLVAFLPWEGYNFEDAIIVSDRLVREDYFTSLHIEEFEAVTRETKLGKEEFTRDIPNVPEKVLNKLDENGMIRVGAFIEPGDILVGKVAPISKTELTPEEKLLHAIFGKAGQDVKNESLRVPAGIQGIVLDAKKLSRNVGLTAQDKKKVVHELKLIDKESYQKINYSISKGISRLKEVLGRSPVKNFEYGKSGSVKNLQHLKSLLDIKNMGIKGKVQYEEAQQILINLFRRVESLENERDKRHLRLTHGVELPTGVHEMVKIYIGMKRNLSVGDKMAGRHGNKGVIAKVAPQEDLPFLDDGTPVDIILNPLGVPSRMNVGQILETHLGWAAKILGLRITTPPFSGATEANIEELMAKANLPRDGKVWLHDGRTGERFLEKVTVGILYVMKLHHLVDDKIHARATGPYSLITQQPLGGRARSGGQRFGEMEVWALEAYGAAHTLQELLTVKSDDIFGRNRIYEAIIKRKNILEPGTPASFEVLLNELKGLCLNVKLEKAKEALS